MTVNHPQAGADFSLRTRLTLLLFLAVLLVGLAQSLLAWHAARSETELVFDTQMQRTAWSLSGAVGAAVLPEQEPLAGTDVQDFIIQVWRADGIMLYHSPSTVLLPPLAEPGFSRVRAGSASYRVYTLQTPRQVVQVAQADSQRRQAAVRLAARVVLPVALLAPALMLIVWWVVGWGLRSVRSLQRELMLRRADELAPLSLAGLPREVAPLVTEMNALLARVARARAAQEAFTGDAAHELRTPLAALRLQVQSLQRAGTPAQRELATRRLLGGIDRATHLVEQLLSLARQQAPALGDRSATVDLVPLVRAAGAEFQAQARARAVRLEVQAPDAATVPGSAPDLELLLRNLLANALQHVPDRGRIRLRVQAADVAHGASLRVEDSGPGIAVAERQRVFDRFYRGTANRAAAGTGGSGLGLAIVLAVAQRHGAQVRAGASEELGGACICLQWPA